MSRHYILLDACVAAAYYAPKSTYSIDLRNRSLKLITSASTDIDVQLLIPNFCIAEVFSVFEKYRWGRTWNKHVNKPQTLTPSEFKTARNNFGEAIHNGTKILQIELNRYHILCVDLISPVNNAYKINRDRSKINNVVPAKTYDMLIAAMGIWLKKQYGEQYFTIVTGDNRLVNVIERAKSIKLGRPIKEHMISVAASLGLEYKPDLYPTVINLTRVDASCIRERLSWWKPEW